MHIKKDEKHLFEIFFIYLNQHQAPNLMTPQYENF
jgi:hypothetical protein